MSYFTRETVIKSGDGWILTRHTHPKHWEVGLRCTCGWSFSCTTIQSEEYQVAAHVADHETGGGVCVSDPRGTARVRVSLDDAIALHVAVSYYKKRPEAPEGEHERLTGLQETLARAARRIEQGVEVPA